VGFGWLETEAAVCVVRLRGGSEKVGLGQRIDYSSSQNRELPAVCTTLSYVGTWKRYPLTGLIIRNSPNLGVAGP